MYCVPYVVRFSAVFIFDCVRGSLTFICPVYCVPYVVRFSAVFIFDCVRGSLTFICPVYCVPYVVRFSAVFILIAPSWFPNVHLSCLLCTLCCQVLHWLPLHGSLTFICPVYCVPYVVRFLGVYFWLCGSLTFIFLVYCVPYVVRFSAVLSILLPLRGSLTFIFCVLCTLCCQVLRSVYY